MYDQYAVNKSTTTIRKSQKQLIGNYLPSDIKLDYKVAQKFYNRNKAVQSNLFYFMSLGIIFLQ